MAGTSTRRFEDREIIEHIASMTDTDPRHVIAVLDYNGPGQAFELAVFMDTAWRRPENRRVDRIMCLLKCDPIHSALCVLEAADERRRFERIGLSGNLMYFLLEHGL